MKLVKSPRQMRRIGDELRQTGKKIGFVPTMGYLHDGHLSLIRSSASECDVTVVSIYVNPLQFGPGEDLQRYPRDLKRDLKLAAAAGADVVFAPSDKQMYPERMLSFIEVEKLPDYLCGVRRPGHFRGVTTVVGKLFNIVGPDRAYFGNKDYQQARVISRMVNDLNFPLKIRLLPTIREADGLAMSSRNAYLNEEERRQARVLIESLRLARRLIREGTRNSEKIKKVMGQLITTRKSAKIDYIQISDPLTLEPKTKVVGDVLVALAVFIGKTRLIDNLIVKGN